MQIEQDKLGKIKHVLHGIQAFVIFIAWCLTIASFTKSGDVGGQSGFFFALCFLSVPALIYQVMVPAWPRAARFANVYAYAAIDILFAILWFGSSIAVAAWVTAGIKTAKDSDGSCAHFAFGEPSKCTITRADAGIGFLIWLLFSATSAISVMMVLRYRQTGVMPGRREGPSFRMRGEDPNKDVWSSNIEERDADDVHDVDERRKYGQVPEEDSDRLLNHQASTVFDTEEHQHDAPHPGDRFSYETPMPTLSTGHHYDDRVPSALSPSVYEPESSTAYQPPPAAHSAQHGRADFPAARYDRL